jgi:hypothetical protein
MFPGTENHPGLARIALRQCGVLRRDQFNQAGAPRGFVVAQLAARRWTAVGQNVVVLQNAAPRRDQLMWMAVLDAAGLVALGSHTALALLGFRSFAREAEEIHLIITRGARTTPLTGVRVPESRRLRSEQLIVVDGLPCTGAARSAIDAAAWQPFPRFACAMVAAVVQQGLASAAELDNELRYVGRVRHKAYLRLAVRDIADGAQSLGELDPADIVANLRALGVPTLAELSDAQRALAS